jgi:hypothetical protein
MTKMTRKCSFCNLDLPDVMSGTALGIDILPSSCIIFNSYTPPIGIITSVSVGNVSVV